jgi:hypothetical protein
MPGLAAGNIAELPTLTIEQRPEYLRCEAKPRPLTRLILTGIGVTGFTLIPMTFAVLRLWTTMHRGRRAVGMETFGVVLSGAVTLAALWIFVAAILRYRKPRRLTIENGQIHVLTPEQPVQEQTLPCVDLKAAKLQGGPNPRIGESNLVLVPRRSPKVIAFTGMPTNELRHVVDHVNRFVRIDEFKAFEVVIPAAGEPSPPLAVLPVEAPLRVLPVEPESL